MSRFVLVAFSIAMLAGCSGSAGALNAGLPLERTVQSNSAQKLAVSEYPLDFVRSLCFNPFRGWVPCLLSPGPHGIAKGNDGALWFTQLVYSCSTFRAPPVCNGAVGRITTSGMLTRYALKNQARPWNIANGSDGALWFTEQTTNKIGRISLSGIITEYSLPSANSSPVGITPGPDGALWFLENGLTPRVGRISTSGSIRQYVIPTANSNPFTIVAGSDGALWFGEFGASKIGRITTAGAITEYATPTKVSGPYSVTRGPDGAVWFVETFVNKLGRITPAGKITEFPAGSNGSFTLIGAGPQGKLWFMQTPSILAGVTTPTGAISGYFLSASIGQNTGMTTGPDGALWITDDGPGQAIARVHP